MVQSKSIYKRRDKSNIGRNNVLKLDKLLRLIPVFPKHYIQSLYKIAQNKSFHPALKMFSVHD